MDTSRLQPIIAALEDGLGNSLVALYLVGSAATPYYFPGHSDINLMLVIGADASLRQVQEVVATHWPAWKSILGSPPSVAHLPAFLRHLALNPALNAHLQAHGRLLSGQLPAPFSRPAPLRVFAFYCTAALTASAALAASRPDEGPAPPTYHQLHRLARRLAARPISGKATARQLFIIVQRELQSRLDQFRGGQIPDRAPAHNLEAIYTQSEKCVFVIPEMSAPELAGLDWATIVQSLDSKFQTIGVTTPTQFRLSLLVDVPLDYALERYVHRWGRNLFPDLPVTRVAIYRALARDASHILVQVLPQGYLSVGHADEKNKLIHDLQNRVLNLHLQAELLQRTQGFPFSVPSIKLPGRETPVDQRIIALHKWLDYWTAYYADAGQQSASAQ
jgi:hypothetical protein